MTGECQTCEEHIVLFGNAYFIRGPQGEHEHIDPTKLIRRLRPSTDAAVMVESIYGANSRRPLVQITAPGAEPVMITPAEARAVAWNILAGAEAAEQDGFVVEFFAANDGRIDPVRVLRAFREWRAAERERATREGREIG